MHSSQPVTYPVPIILLELTLTQKRLVEFADWMIVLAIGPAAVVRVRVCMRERGGGGRKR